MSQAMYSPELDKQLMPIFTVFLGILFGGIVGVGIVIWKILEFIL